MTVTKMDWTDAMLWPFISSINVRDINLSMPAGFPVVFLIFKTVFAYELDLFATYSWIGGFHHSLLPWYLTSFWRPTSQMLSWIIWFSELWYFLDWSSFEFYAPWPWVLWFLRDVFDVMYFFVLSVLHFLDAFCSRMCSCACWLFISVYDSLGSI